MIGAKLLVTLATLIPHSNGGSETPEACAKKCEEKREYQKARRTVPHEPIPHYITHCESKDNLRALNPASGAGGRYQILPSTWRVSLPSRRFVRISRGNKGPRWSSRLLQDKVAQIIYRRDGASAWSCA